MNIKSLCLLGATCVSIGASSGTSASLPGHDYNGEVTTTQIAGQTEQSVPVTPENEIACIQKISSISNQIKSGEITIQESKDLMLQMIPELLILLPTPPLAANKLELNRKVLLTNFIENVDKKFEQYSANNNTANNPEVNADTQNEDVAYGSKLSPKDKKLLLLEKGTDIYLMVLLAHRKKTEKHAIKRALFDCLNPIYNQFGKKHPYRNYSVFILNFYLNSIKFIFNKHITQNATHILYMCSI